MRLTNNVNTPFREESVQIHPDGKTFIFQQWSSWNGRLDIFMTRKKKMGIGGIH